MQEVITLFSAVSGFSLGYRGCGAGLGLHRATTQSVCHGWAQLQLILRVQVLPVLGRHWISCLPNNSFGLVLSLFYLGAAGNTKALWLMLPIPAEHMGGCLLHSATIILFLSQTPMKAWKVQLFMHNKTWSLSWFVSANVVKTRQYPKLHKRCAFLMQSITILASQTLCQNWVNQNIPDILIHVHTPPVCDVCLLVKEQNSATSKIQ